MLVKTTPQLREGDIVHTDTMVLLIDGTPELSRAHAGGQTYWYAAKLLNEDEVREIGHVPMSWLYTDSRGQRRTEPRWVIQGNELARWWVDPAEARLAPEAR